MLIDLELAKQHLKADGDTDEDSLIEQYILSATAICEGYCNRKIYPNSQAKLDDYELAVTDFIEARTARDDAYELAGDDSALRLFALNTFLKARSDIFMRVYGVVVDDTITAAILMVLGHLYSNRQEVVVAQYSGATQLPAGAKRILEPYLRISVMGEGE